MADAARGIDEHYGRPDLGRALLGGLRAAGVDPEALAPGDLAGVDHFHTRSLEATSQLARWAAIEPGARVLDVGGGIGGAARFLAHEVGCPVSVLDLTEEFCRVGADLTRRVGLAHLVSFHHGNALDMPFPAAAFDVAWTQHSSMNVPDKEGLYREICRVLRPGGRLAMHEIMAGPRQPIQFPVPWAREPAISHLRPPETVRGLLHTLGFRERSWQDQSALSLEWFRERAAATRAASAPPPLALHLLLGPEAGRMFANVVQNLEEDRIRIVMGVWERP